MMVELDRHDTLAPLISLTGSPLYTQPAFVAGWGNIVAGTSGSIFPNSLMEASLQMVADDVCRTKPSVNAQFTPGTMICAGGSPGICAGDDGSPLFQNINGIFVLIGVASVMNGCGSADTPGLFAATLSASNRGFITEIVNGATPAPLSASFFNFPVINVLTSEAVTSLQVTVRRTGIVAADASIVISTQENGGAKAGADFDSITGFRLDFASGVVDRSLSVRILEDRLVEDPERFLLILSSPSTGAVIGSASIMTVTINDNDGGPILLAPTSGPTAPNATRAPTTVVPGGSTSTSSSSSNKLSAGAIVGIVIAAVVIVLIFAALAAAFVVKGKRDRENAYMNASMNSSVAGGVPYNQRNPYMVNNNTSNLNTSGANLNNSGYGYGGPVQQPPPALDTSFRGGSPNSSRTYSPTKALGEVIIFIFSRTTHPSFIVSSFSFISLLFFFFFQFQFC